ncbi:MAG: LPS assembly protein LptD [Rickettsiales bacterium]|nr:LPS assembly protein LptD [Rickettsiales bacterium]
MQADQLGYDQKNAIVVAQGNVEVAQGQTKLLAQRITYYQNYNVVRADGNVRVIDAKGEVYYADQVQLRDDLMEGVVKRFRALMSDNSQFTAHEARRLSEDYVELTKALYTPCEVCEGESPFWQIKADKIAVDGKKQRVYYDDVTLEFMGVPVAYAPYFFHPTPEAERKSGFLKPEYSQSSNLGTMVKVPYYWNISPDMDATITPIFTSEEGIIMQGEYRQMFDDGQMQFNGSITYPDKRDAQGLVIDDREIRGHIFAQGYYNLDEHWRSGFDVQRSTDDTYLRKYRYGNHESLNSRIYTEGVYGRSYIDIEAMAFQGLRSTDDPDREPLILPLATGYYESDPMWHGSRYFLSANTQVVTRDEGDKSARFSTSAGYKLPHVTEGGHVFESEMKVRTDVYSISETTLNNGQSYEGEEVRVIPQASLKWRYPLLKQWNESSLILEPTVLAVASTNGNNPDEIPNEDNRIVEFSDAVLFSTERFPGYDTVDEGSRIAYGMRGQWLMDDDTNVQFMFGQNFSFEDDTPYPYNNEPGESFSDYVGRLAVSYNPVTVAYRFRLDQHDFKPNTNALEVAYTSSSFSFRTHYVSLDNDNFLLEREEILMALQLALSDEWSINGSMRRDLLTESMIYAGGGLTYQNDCFMLQTGVNRSYIRDRDVEPDTNFTVRVAFKNLNSL